MRPVLRLSTVLRNIAQIHWASECPHIGYIINEMAGGTAYMLFSAGRPTFVF